MTESIELSKVSDFLGIESSKITALCEEKAFRMLMFLMVWSLFSASLAMSEQGSLQQRLEFEILRVGLFDRYSRGFEDDDAQE